jgi:flagellar basal-body rod protein FlgF
MNVSLYQAASAMNASSRWQEVIADNLAASQVPGFKKQDMSFSAVQAGYLTGTGSAGGVSRACVPLAGTATNFQSGQLHPTLTTTDFAVEGPGFFEVKLPDGNAAYTRDGEFRVTLKGDLLSKQGLPVMGKSGPIKLDPRSASPMTVSETGEIKQDGTVKGQLKITEFDNPAALENSATGLFLVNNASVQAHAAKASLVRQGFLENANLSTMVEMGNLISAMRFYEANNKVIQSHDERVGKLITDVANPA